VAETITIRGIWSAMPDELAARILSELRGEQPDLYREAQGTAAAALNMRPQVFRQQPAPRQAATIRRVFTQVGRETVAAHVLIEWLTRLRKPMLVQFLDDLGVTHEDGTVSEGVGEEPEREKLTAAIRHLRETFPAGEVTAYLSAFYLTTGYEWKSLPELIEAAATQPAGATEG
jgi:hypothetical protein